MSRQDRTGSNYEKLLAFFLEILGYKRSSKSRKNCLHPPKNSEIIILRTYIQPDIVVRSGEKIEAVLYSTLERNSLIKEEVQWTSGSRGRTLDRDQFRTLSWDPLRRALISQAIKDCGYLPSRAKDDVVILYLQNKSMRIISSDLNGFSILIDHYLGDLCHFIFREEEEANAGNALGARARGSRQIDMVNRLWGGNPLATWMEGVSRDGEWQVKVQSAQDGDEGHKTKELLGRCRAFRLDWLPGINPADRSDWKFSLRRMTKVALVLDGDWYRTNKKNLYEAGWDWVGDVTELEEVRRLIQQR
jgi:hypothetical protein